MVSFAIPELRPTTSWPAAFHHAQLALDQPGRDIIHLAREAKATQATSADEALFKVGVYVMAGMEPEAVEALMNLHKLDPEFADANLFYTARYYSLWALACATVELFGDRFGAEPLSEPPDLLWLLLEPLEKAGWSTERIDQWLSTLPPGPKDWMRLARLRFNLRNNRGDALVEQLIAAVRTDPRDTRSALLLLTAVTTAGTPQVIQGKWSSTWTPEVVHPRLATESAKLGKLLGEAGESMAAISFLKLALEMPFTSEDAATFGPFPQIPGPSVEALQRDFRANTLETLAHCLTALKETEEAEKLTQEAMTLRAKRILEWRPTSQSALPPSNKPPQSGMDLEAQETTRGTEPEYWLQRALYHQQLGEREKAEHAFQKGLAVAPAQPGGPPVGKGSGRGDLRSTLLHDYAGFLSRHERVAEGVDLLWREFREAPAFAASRRTALECLLWSMSQRISASDEQVWRWLDEQQIWRTTEGTIIEQMLRAGVAEARPKLWERAELLAQVGHPSRAYAVGHEFANVGNYAGGIRLLERTLALTDDRELARLARADLISCHLGAGNWRKVEATLSQQESGNRHEQESVLFGRLALMAAKDGAKGDAIRLWSCNVRRNPHDMQDLSALAKLGLRDELIAVYRALQRALPTSRIPARALKILEAEKAN